MQPSSKTLFDLNLSLLTFDNMLLRDLLIFRSIWQQRTRIRTDWPTPHFFLMINDEVVDSELSQTTKAQIPFVYAIDPEYNPLEGAKQDENDTVYRGYLTTAVKMIPIFWCEGGLDAGM